jgi:PAS domain S-box-containing protein
MMRDITEKKRAEEALKEANAQISQLLTSISSILIGLSKKGIINQWNSTAEKTFGIATADAIGKHFLQCGIVWDSNIVVENLNKCKAKNVPIHLDIWYIRPDGQEGLLDLQFNYIEDDSKKHRGYVLLGKDITEKKRIESQIALSQKLESIGQLAAGIAHEINTPMQYIGDNTRFLEDAFKDIISVLQEYKNIFAKFENSQVSIHLFEKVKTKEKDFDLEYLADEVPKAIEQSLEGIERVRTLILAMKNFSHPGSSEKMFSDINKGIQGTIIISKNEWKYVAEIETILDPDLPLVNCAIDQINQVILSMIINSSQAIKDVIGNNSALKGKIVIETKYEDPFVNIIISDSGKGIPQSIMHKIFDPFFTTKDVGKGTGQGLAIAYDIIINKHNGSIDVYSELEKGTTFIIQFPVGN